MEEEHVQQKILEAKAQLEVRIIVPQQSEFIVLLSLSVSRVSTTHPPAIL